MGSWGGTWVSLLKGHMRHPGGDENDSYLACMDVSILVVTLYRPVRCYHGGRCIKDMKTLCYLLQLDVNLQSSQSKNIPSLGLSLNGSVG